MNGICTLANDRVYDQLIALLNSIEAIQGKDTPVCVYPYDDNTEKIAAEISKRPNVQLFSNRDVIEEWDSFVRAMWDTHPTAKERWLRAGSNGYHRFGTHRRYGAFSAPFDRFLYMDADTLLLNPVDEIFEKLDSYDCVVYDFQYKDPTHVYEVNSPQLTKVFSQERIKTEIFCSGFYASKKDLFDRAKRDWLIDRSREGEAEILYPMAPDQTIVNYMMMRSGCSIYNFALQLTKEEKTGCCVTSSHFQERDYILYDKGKRLTYLHYIGIPSKSFTELCAGKNIDFPYRDLFLHYRYLYEPEHKPQLIGKPQQETLSPNFVEKAFKKLGIKI
ncbi:MAG: Npun_R2821/Npun_R2822 family protein [Xenococcaceae cyanobacterium]